MLKYQYFFQIKYTEAILSNSTGKLLWTEITKMLIAVYKKLFTALFIIIFGALSFPMQFVRTFYETVNDFNAFSDIFI